MIKRIAQAFLFLGLLLQANLSWAYYGTVEYLDGRMVNGRIQPVGRQEEIGVFVPSDGAYMMTPLVEIQRIEFNWNYNPNVTQPYYLRNAGDIKIIKINGEIIKGAYFGSGQGIREFMVTLDDMRETPVKLNDTKMTKNECIRYIYFETTHVPAPPDGVVVSNKSGQATQINYRVNVDITELLDKPFGDEKAKVRFGVPLSLVNAQGEWVQVKTVGAVEVTGWVKLKFLEKEKN